MLTRSLVIICTFFISTLTVAQGSVFRGQGAIGGVSTGNFSELQSAIGYKAANRAENLRVDGSPYLFENWDQGAVITTKGGDKFRFKDVNIDGRRNKIIARINKDSIYTFNSLAIAEAVVNGKVFKNIMAPNNGPIKVYEIIAETGDFQILKDYTVDISEGSSNPMRGTVYSKYITRENYKILRNNELDKFSLKKKSVLKLLANKKEAIINYVEEKDLNYKNEKDVNEIVQYFSEL